MYRLSIRVAVTSLALFSVALFSLAVGGNPCLAQHLPQPAEHKAITISGAVSMGSYEAGLNWTLLLSMKAARQQDASKKQLLTAVTGASAGNINALITAASWCQQETRESSNNNPFFNTWIPIGWPRLFPADTPNPCQLAQLESCSDLEHAPHDVIRQCYLLQEVFAGACILDDRIYGSDDMLMSRAAFAKAVVDIDGWFQHGRFRDNCQVPIGITLTRVQPDIIAFGQSPHNKVKVETQRFVVPLLLTTSSRGVVFENLWIPSKALGKVFSLAQDATRTVDPIEVYKLAQASAAFPIAFGQKQLQNKSGHNSLFLDGGFFDNIPLGLATALAATRPGSNYFSLYDIDFIYVSPDTLRMTPEEVLDYRVHTDLNSSGQLIDLVQNAVTVAREYELQVVQRVHAQARETLAEMGQQAPQVDQHVDHLTQQLIPLFPEGIPENIDRSLQELGQDAQTIGAFQGASQQLTKSDLRVLLTSRNQLIYGRHLLAFAAFFSRGLRLFDYYTGIYDGLYFLASQRCQLEDAKVRAQASRSGMGSDQRATDKAYAKELRRCVFEQFPQVLQQLQQGATFDSDAVTVVNNHLCKEFDKFVRAEETGESQPTAKPKPQRSFFDWTQSRQETTFSKQDLGRVREKLFPDFDYIENADTVSDIKALCDRNEEEIKDRKDYLADLILVSNQVMQEMIKTMPQLEEITCQHGSVTRNLLDELLANDYDMTKAIASLKRGVKPEECPVEAKVKKFQSEISNVRGYRFISLLQKLSDLGVPDKLRRCLKTPRCEYLGGRTLADWERAEITFFARLVDNWQRTAIDTGYQILSRMQYVEQRAPAPQLQRAYNATEYALRTYDMAAAARVDSFKANTTLPDGTLAMNLIPSLVGMDVARQALFVGWQPVAYRPVEWSSLAPLVELSGGCHLSQLTEDKTVPDCLFAGLGGGAELRLHFPLKNPALPSALGLAAKATWDLRRRLQLKRAGCDDHFGSGAEVSAYWLADKVRVAAGTRDICRLWYSPDYAGRSQHLSLTLGINDVSGLVYWLPRFPSI